MILNDYYWYFEKALDLETCDRMMDAGIDSLKQIEKEHGLKGIQAQSGGHTSRHNDADTKRDISQDNKTFEELEEEGISPDEVYVRDTHVAWLEHEWIYEALWPFLTTANKSAGWDYNIDFSETLQFTKYSPGQYYGWHMDGQPDVQLYISWDDINKDKDLYLEKNEKGEFLTDYKGGFIIKRPYTSRENYHNKYRKLSMTVTLSDPNQYEGGDFIIDRGPHFKGDRYYVAEEIKPKGSIIVFPSFLYHRVAPVTKGIRHSIVMWSIGPKWV